MLDKKRNNVRRFYKCTIHPKDREICPIEKNDCNNCDYCNYIGTFGGDYYVECSFENNVTETTIPIK